MTRNDERGENNEGNIVTKPKNQIYKFTDNILARYIKNKSNPPFLNMNTRRLMQY